MAGSLGDLSIGDIVRIHSLGTAAAVWLNDLSGKIVSFDDRTGRFGVQVHGGFGLKALRPSNLTLVPNSRGQDLVPVIDLLRELNNTKRFLPEFIRGKRVIMPTETQGLFRLDNSDLQSSLPGVQCRCSMAMDDKELGAMAMVRYGATIQGVLAHGWLEVLSKDVVKSWGIPAIDVGHLN